MALVGILKKALAREQLYVISSILAANVANNGTVTLAYPQGTNEATFSAGPEGAQAFVAIINKSDIWPVSTGKITVTFSASNITLTNTSGVQWNAGQYLDVQLDAVTGSVLPVVYLVSQTLTSAVTNGSACPSVPYPLGTNQYTYTGGPTVGSSQSATISKNLVYTSGASQISVAFNATGIVVTNNSAVTWPIGATVDLQLFVNAVMGVAYNAALDSQNIYLNLADIATGSYAADPGYNGNLVSFAVRVQKPSSTAGKAATLTASINGTGITTGGVVSMTTANTNTEGGLLTDSAIVTGPNLFTAGQPVGVIASAVTAFVEGSIMIELGTFNSDLAALISAMLTQ